MASSFNPTPPPETPKTNPTPPLGAPNPTPTPPSETPSSDVALPPGAPNATPTPLPEVPNPTPTPLPEAPNPTPTPPSRTPSTDTTLPTGAPNTTPTPSPGTPNPTPTPPSRTPSLDTTLPIRAPNTTPTPPPGPPNPTPTPPSGTPSLDATLPYGAPNTTPTPPLGAPNPTPIPLSGTPTLDATLPTGAPNPIPTSPSRIPSSDATLPSGAHNTTPTPPSETPSSVATLSSGAPNTALTPPSRTPSSDATLPPKAPNTTPAPALGTPSFGPTPSPEAPDTTATPPSGAPNSDPAPSSGAQITTPTPASEAPSSNQAPSPDQAPNTIPTPPSGAPVSDPIPPPEGPSTTPIPSSEAPNSDQAPPPNTTSSPDTTSMPSDAPTPERLVQLLTEKDDKTKTIILRGGTGVGKTWLAREISKKISKNIREAGKESVFGGTLWLSLNKKYHGIDPRTRSRLILEDIARQLCVLPPTEGGFEDDKEDDDDQDSKNKLSDDDHRQEDKKSSPEKDSNIIPDHDDSLDIMVIQQVEKGAKENKFFVLTLDGVPEYMDVEAEIIGGVKSLQRLRKNGLLKLILLVTTKSTGTSTSTESSTKKDDDQIREFLIGPLKKDENLKLLKSSAGETQGSEKFEDYFSVPLPAAVAVVMGKALKHNFSQPGGHDDDQDEAFENALREAAEAEKIGTLLVRYAFDTLPRGDATMIKCCWHSRKFFEAIDNGSVHYNELICHWIMEGYLDDVKHSSIEKAYKEGYRIWEELKKRGLLKVEDGDFVTMEGVALKVRDHRREGFDETAMLGLPDVFRDDKEWQGLGKIAVADGMIKSVCWPKKWRNVSTLMIDETRLCREVPNTFFKCMNELRVLVLLKPRLRTLDFIGGEGEASQLSKLRLLVLRGCDVLEKIDPIKKLESLVVLEVSGAESLTKIPDDLFAKMSQLRSLNLSGSQVQSLGFSFSNLTKLRWLILRGCSNLEEMPSLKAFADLEVLDMFGSCSLTKFRDKKFGSLTKLRVVDFSQAKIAPLPFFNPLVGLTRLTLRHCTEITRLPHLDNLHGLQFLELPGGTKLKEFYSPHFKNKEALRILDLSKTDLSRLPSTLSDLPRLEALDLSHMSSLKDLEGVSFNKYACLQSLNLSNTNVKSLPSLSNLKSLRQLMLNDCPCLEALPEVKELTSLEILDLSRASELKEMSDHTLELKKLRQLLLPECKKLENLPILGNLTKLEVLDLSGCEALKELEKQSFQGMSALQVLDLSATKVQRVRYLPTSPKFRRLLLENCTELGEIPTLDLLSNLEELNMCGAMSLQKPEAKSSPLEIKCKSLQTLNLSGTSIVLSSDFTKFTNLKNLSVKGCLFLKKPQLKELLKLEVLDLSDTKLVKQEALEKLSNLGDLIKSGKALSLKELSGDLKSLLNLSILHLWGLEVEEFPYWISDLVHLKSLSLPNLAGIKQLEWGQKIKRLPDNLNWKECDIFKNAGIHQASRGPSISMSIANLQLLRQQSDIWKKCFSTFRIYVCPSNESGKDEDIYRLRDNSFFEDIYFKTICCPESCKRFLEIRGFKNLPDGLENVLSEGENLPDCVSFIDDDFISSLTDLGAENLEAMTGLWLERCVKTEFLFSEEKAIKLGEGFSLLWASNLPLLKSLYKGNVQDQSFKNLTQLYLDCCPMLEYVFSSSQLPEKLEKLQVKFCDKLKTLLEGEPSTTEHKLPNLSKLILLELPELTTVGFKLPSLRKAEVKGCPKLKKKEFIDGLGLENKNVEVTNVEEDWGGGSNKESKEYPFGEVKK